MISRGVGCKQITQILWRYLLHTELLDKLNLFLQKRETDQSYSNKRSYIYTYHA